MFFSLVSLQKNIYYMCYKTFKRPFHSGLQWGRYYVFHLPPVPPIDVLCCTPHKVAKKALKFRNVLVWNVSSLKLNSNPGDQVSKAVIGRAISTEASQRRKYQLQRQDRTDQHLLAPGPSAAARPTPPRLSPLLVSQRQDPCVDYHGDISLVLHDICDSNHLLQPLDLAVAKAPPKVPQTQLLLNEQPLELPEHDDQEGDPYLWLLDDIEDEELLLQPLLSKSPVLSLPPTPTPTTTTDNNNTDTQGPRYYDFGGSECKRKTETDQLWPSPSPPTVLMRHSGSYASRDFASSDYQSSTNPRLGTFLSYTGGRVPPTPPSHARPFSRSSSVPEQYLDPLCSNDNLLKTDYHSPYSGLADQDPLSWKSLLSASSGAYSNSSYPSSSLSARRQRLSRLGRQLSLSSELPTSEFRPASGRVFEGHLEGNSLRSAPRNVPSSARLNDAHHSTSVTNSASLLSRSSPLTLGRSLQLVTENFGSAAYNTAGDRSTRAGSKKTVRFNSEEWERSAATSLHPFSYLNTSSTQLSSLPASSSRNLLSVNGSDYQRSRFLTDFDVLVDEDAWMTVEDVRSGRWARWEALRQESQDSQTRDSGIETGSCFTSSEDSNRGGTDHYFSKKVPTAAKPTNILAGSIRKYWKREKESLIKRP